MDNIEEILKLKIDEIENYEFEYELELGYTSGFYEYLQLNLNNISLLHLLKNSSFVANLIIVNNILPYNEVDEIMYHMEDILDELPTDRISCIALIGLLHFIKNNDIDKINKTTKKLQYKKTKELVDFMVYIDNIEVFNNLFTFLQIKDYCKIIEIGPDDLKFSYYKTLIQDILSDKAYNNYYNEVILKTKNYIRDLKKKKSDEININKKRLIIYKKLLSELSNNNLIKYQDYINELDDEFKVIILSEILKHNQKYYLEINDKLNNFNNNISEILRLNGFDFNKIDKFNQERLNNKFDINIINEVLSIINKEPFYIKETEPFFTDILLCSSKNILNNIINLYKHEYLDIHFIHDNIGILLSDSNQSLTNYKCLYETLIKNINLYKSLNFNINNVKNSNPKMLLMDNNIINERLYLFKQYHINFDNQRNINYKYFTDDFIFNIIDSFIELGEYDYIKDNIETIYNNSFNIVKRIYISNMINYNIWNDNNKLNNSIISGYLFPIKDNELDDYIINCTHYYMDKDIVNYFDNSSFNYSNIINILDNNYLNNDNYLFDDIIISRNKVIRNISSISNKINIDEFNIKSILLNAIIYNSILDTDQIEIIKEEINNLFSRKRKIKTVD